MTHLPAFTASLEAVADRCEDVVPPVYAALFERFPEFEKLFVLDIDHGARGHMLNEALSMAEGLLQDDPVAISFVSAERMNHEGYGIDDDVFEGFYLVMAEVFETRPERHGRKRCARPGPRSRKRHQKQNCNQLHPIRGLIAS